MLLFVVPTAPTRTSVPAYCERCRVREYATTMRKRVLVLVAPNLLLFVLQLLRRCAVGVLLTRMLHPLSATTTVIPGGCDARLPHRSGVSSIGRGKNGDA